MDSPSNPIGVFDSGIGGLTVFQQIKKFLPYENLVYLGDTARVPYGNKSPETICRYSEENAAFLDSHQVKMIVVACNTASAFALETGFLKTKTSKPLLGVIRPGAEAALKKSFSKKIGIIGTEGTIKSQAYPKALRELDSNVVVQSMACPLFAPLVEEGWWEGEVVEKIAHHYIDPLLKSGIDTLILGCTHYPLLKKTLQKITGNTVTLIDSAEETAQATLTLLKNENLLKTDLTPGDSTFFSTDSTQHFQKMAELFLQHPLSKLEQVHFEK